MPHDGSHAVAEKKQMRSFRLSPDAIGRISRLAVAWGGIKPLDATSVVEHALALAEQALNAPPKKNPRKSSDRA